MKIDTAIVRNIQQRARLTPWTGTDAMPRAPMGTAGTRYRLWSFGLSLNR